MMLKLVVWALLSWSGVALAAGSARLDDSASVVIPPNAQMQWRSLLPGQGRSSEVESQFQLIARINVKAWMGRQARIYLVLEPDGGPVVRAQWRAQGRLLGGQVRSGERALVFAGAISQAILEDTLLFSLRADGRGSGYTRQLQFYFEMDAD